MPRTACASAANVCHHVLNRGTRRAWVLPQDGGVAVVQRSDTTDKAGARPSPRAWGILPQPPRRNHSARVEAIAPIEHRNLKERLWEILQVSLQDQRQAWDMQSDGTYIQRKAAADATGPARDGLQATLMALTLSRSGSTGARQGAVTS
jgi:hypothetical protein